MAGPSTTELVTLGFSPCPNDTFMFHGLVLGQVPVEGVAFSPVIEDIAALNQRAVTGEEALAVSKLSVSALGRVTDRYTVLRSGAALGRGCGPLVVAKEAIELAQLANKTIAIPGLHTTAHLLLRMFAPAGIEVLVMRFDEIMPALAAGKADAGVIIHEGRFTFARYGLQQVTDLGERWEHSTGLPLPLGVICARRSLEHQIIDRVEAGLRASIQLAFDQPRRPRAFIKQHAAEMDPEVCRQHIELYVNDYSVDLGDEGVGAIDEMLGRGRDRGILPADGPSAWR
jgi:1,4-dihydroxy-6-naphthoate synthase